MCMLQGLRPYCSTWSNDPDELTDLGRSPDHVDIRQSMFNKLAEWSLQYRQRETWSEEAQSLE